LSFAARAADLYHSTFVPRPRCAWTPRGALARRHPSPSAAATGSKERNVYAVIKVAGKQHRVEKGRWFLVDQPEAQDITAEVLLVADGSTVKTGDDAKKATVKLSKAGTVRIRGERSMRFKPKEARSSKRTLGYRRTLVKVSCDSISL
jgi:ribosomal protein L21